MNLYEALGVHEDSDTPAIRAAYIDKAKTAHPDAGGNEKEFHRISRAFETLSDPDKRSHYDKTGEIREESEGNLRSQALNLLARMMMQVLVGSLPLDSNVLGAMVEDLSNQLQGLAKQDHTAAIALERANRMRGMFSSGEDDVLTPMIENSIKMLEQNRSDSLKDVEVRRYAIHILADHEYDGWRH